MLQGYQFFWLSVFFFGHVVGEMEGSGSSNFRISRNILCNI